MFKRIVIECKCEPFKFLAITPDLLLQVSCATCGIEVHIPRQKLVANFVVVKDDESANVEKEVEKDGKNVEKRGKFLLF